VWEHSGLREERIYLGGYEVYRRWSVGTPPAQDVLKVHRTTLHVMDDQRRVAMVENALVDTIDGLSGRRWRFQLDNHLGTATLEVDQAGKVISYEEYHPYGTSALRVQDSSAGVSQKRYRYTGKERDEETSLYYHGARYYAPWLGRWTAADPLGVAQPGKADLNIYAYVRSSPINRVDVSGLKDDDFGGELPPGGLPPPGNTTTTKPPGADGSKAATEKAVAEYRRNKQELESAEPFAAMAEATYRDGGGGPVGNWRRLSEREIIDAGLDAKMFQEKTSGFAASLWVNDKKEYTLAFRGTETDEGKLAWSTRADVKTDMGQAFGLSTKQHTQAIKLANAVKDKLKLGINALTMTGHSLGGGLAATAATATGSRALTFNAAGVNPSTLEDATKQRRAGVAPGKVTNYVVPGDPVTNLQKVAHVMTMPTKIPTVPVAVGRQVDLGSPGGAWGGIESRHSIAAVRKAIGVGISDMKREIRRFTTWPSN
jgi:RHS repeat-associated protein